MSQKQPNVDDVDLTLPEETIQRRSAADFFQDNKAIAGFDNSLRVVFTSVRELVENGLDAAERIQRLPELNVRLELLTAEEIATLLEVDKYTKKESTHQDFIRLTVEDNGMGVPKADVPDLFGRVLTGSNYGARQTRGRFGLGAKMVLLNAMSTVDLPIIVKTRYYKAKVTTEHHLFIDLQKNEPKIEKEETYRPKDPESLSSSGTKVTVTFTGSWSLAKRYVKEYFHQLSIITPYASFEVDLPDNEFVRLERVVDEMPPYPKQTQIHPWGCDITQLKREIAYTNASDMVTFLRTHFQGINAKKAREFLKFINIPESTHPKKLTGPEIRRIVHDGFLVQDSGNTDQSGGKGKQKAKAGTYTFKFPRPSGEGLSPLGEDRLQRGLMKELEPQLVEATTRHVSAYSGHAFVVEAAIAYGGKQLVEERDEGTGRSNLRVYRFANRIPLLFGAGNDVITKVIMNDSMVRWKDYKINLNNAPIAIAVSIVSTKLPFPETSKEYIADVVEIREEIAEALKTLGARIRTHLSRRERADRERHRRSRFERFAPIVSSAVLDVLQNLDDQPFELQHLDNLLTRALVEGSPRSVQKRKPPSKSLRRIKQWVDFPTPRLPALGKKGIRTLADFLVTPSEELVMEGLTLKQVRYVKRVTTEELDADNNTPRVSSLKLIPSEVENGFPEFEKVSKALSRRWISTVYDFFVSEPEAFLKVQGFNPKLWSLFKRDLVKRLTREGLLKAPQYELGYLPWMTKELQEEFDDNDISSVPWFLVSFPIEFTNRKSFPVFNQFILQLVRQEVREKIANLDDNLNANLFPWLSGAAKKYLNGKKLRSWQDLVDTIDSSPRTISQNKDLIISVVSHLRDKIIEETREENSIVSLSELETLESKDKALLKRQKIVTLYDLLMKQVFPHDTLFKKFFQEFRGQVLRGWNKGSVPLINEMVWIPPELEEKFDENDVFTIYDFLILPSRRIEEISNFQLDLATIAEMKRQYGIPLNYFPSEVRKELEQAGVVTTEELMHLSSSTVGLGKDLWRVVEKAQQTLRRPVVCLSGLPLTSIHSLYHLGVMSVYDFLVWPAEELRKAQIQEYQVFEIKNHLELEALEERYNDLTIPLSSLGYLDQKAVSTLSQVGWTTVEEALFSKTFDLADRLDELGVAELQRQEVYHSFDRLQKQIQSPIVFHPKVEPLKVHRFLENGVRTFVEFFYCNESILADFFPETPDFTVLRRDIPEIKQGLPLEETHFFSSSEISSLKREGIRFIEEIYFSLNRNTFAVPKVDWGRIRDVKMVLDLPVGLIVFEEVFQPSSDADDTGSMNEEVRSTQVKVDKPITLDMVSKLNSGHIHTILEFLLVSPNYLSSILDLTEKEVKGLQKKLKVKSEEEKMPLEEGVLGLAKADVRTLLQADITTVEDLYFVTEEQVGPKPELVPFIRSLKKALDCPLRLFPEFRPDIRHKLEERQVSTVGTFLMFPTKELAQVLEISEERIEENFKRRVNVSLLASLLTNSIAVFSELSGKTLLKLRNGNVKTIGDLLVLNQTELEGLVSDPTLYKIYHSLTLPKLEEHVSKATELLTQVLSKQLVTEVQRAGFSTLHEVVYFAEKQDFEAQPDVWDQIIKITSLLKLPADYFVPEEYLDSLRSVMLEGYMSVIDIHNLDPANLPPNTIEQSDFSAILEALSLERLAKVSQLPLYAHPKFLKKTLEPLERVGVRRVGDFLLLSSGEQMDLLGWDKEVRKYFLANLNLPEVVGKLEVSPQLLLDLTTKQARNLGRRRITTLFDLLTADLETQCEALEFSEAEVSSYLSDARWSLFWIALDTSIYLAYPLQAIWRAKLHQTGYRTIGKFMTEDEAILGEVLDYSDRYIASIKTSFSLHELEQSWDRHEHWFLLLRQYLSTRTQKHNLDQEVEIQGVTIERGLLKTFLELPLVNFESLIDTKTRTVLENNGVVALWELLSWSFDDLTRTKLKDGEARALYEAITLTNLLEGLTKPLPLSKVPFLEDDLLGAFEEAGIETYENLIAHFEREKDPPKEIGEVLPKLYRVLQHPTILLPSFGLDQKQTLLAEQLGTLSDILREDLGKVAEKIDLTEDLLKKKLASLSIGELEKHRIHNGNLVSSLNALPEQMLETLANQLPFEDLTFEELFFTSLTISLNKSEKSQLERLRTGYFAPVTYYPQLMHDYPHVFKCCRAKGLTLVYELISFSGSSLSNFLEIPDDIGRKLRYSLDFDKIKKDLKKEQVPLKPGNAIIGLTEEDVQRLKSLGINSLQEVAFPAYYLLPKKDHQWVSEKSDKVRRMFQIPISRLDGLKFSRIPFLRKKGVETVGDFLFGSSKLVRALAKMKVVEMESIRSDPQLNSKSGMAESLEEMLGRANANGAEE